MYAYIVIYTARAC